MAGVKGRSGGARPGAGRKPRPPATTAAPEPPQFDGEPAPSDAREFLTKVMRGQIVPSVPQLEAAKLLARLEAAPAGGKKAAKQGDAEKAAGKFGARPAPLKVVGGRG